MLITAVITRSTRSNINAMPLVVWRADRITNH
jgi:hypothetical protein